MKKIKVIRVFMGISQTEFGRRVGGISQPTISRLESGRIGDAPAGMVLKAKVAEFLGNSVEEIFPED